jgi:hypothetical protein
MRKLFEIGGIVAAAVLVAFGIATLVIGFNGRDTVTSSLKAEQIVGSPDMTPAAIAPEVQAIKAAQAKIAATAKKAGVAYTPTPITVPGKAVAGKLVSGGDRAHAFAGYMRIHTLGATNGLAYAQMGRFTAKPGTPLKYTDLNGGTNDPKYALTDPKTQRPVANGARDIWVTETALTTALNASYMADRISMFGVVVGVALLLSGLGFGILAVGGALRGEPAIRFLAKRVTPAKPVPTT